MGVDLPKKSAASAPGSSDGQTGIAGRKRKRNSVASSESQIQSGNSVSSSSMSSASVPTGNGNMHGAGQSSTGQGQSSSDVSGSVRINLATIKSIADVINWNEADVRKVAERMIAERKEVTHETLLNEIDGAEIAFQSPVGTSGSETQESSYSSLPNTLETSHHNVQPSFSSSGSSFPSLPPPISNGRSSSPHSPQRPSTYYTPGSNLSSTSRRQGHTPSADEDVVDGSPILRVGQTSYSDDVETDSCLEEKSPVDGIDGIAHSCMAGSHSEPQAASLSTSRPTAGMLSRPTASTSQRKSSSASSTSTSSASSVHKLTSAQPMKSDQEQTKVQWADSTHLGKGEFSKGPEADKSYSVFNEDATAYKSLESTTSDDESVLESTTCDDESAHSSKDDTSSKNSDMTVALRSKEAELVHQLLTLVQKENELLSRNRQCIECSSKQREVTFLPCGHFTTCSTCAEPIFTCRLCKKRILGTVTTYLS